MNVFMRELSDVFMKGESALFGYILFFIAHGLTAMLSLMLLSRIRRTKSKVEWWIDKVLLIVIQEFRRCYICLTFSPRGYFNFQNDNV